MKNQTLENQQSNVAQNSAEHEKNLTGALSSAIEVSPFVAGATLLTVPADGIQRESVHPLDISASVQAAPVPPGAAPRDGWEGSFFYVNGKRYVVALSPEISKNGLHELRTYRFDGDKSSLPSEKLSTTDADGTATFQPSIITTPTNGNGKNCLFCGRQLVGRKGAKYCSLLCKDKYFKQRKAAGLVISKVNHKNQSEGQNVTPVDTSKPNFSDISKVGSL